MLGVGRCTLRALCFNFAVDTPCGHMVEGLPMQSPQLVAVFHGRTRIIAVQVRAGAWPSPRPSVALPLSPPQFAYFVPFWANSGDLTVRFVVPSSP